MATVSTVMLDSVSWQIVLPASPQPEEVNLFVMQNCSTISLFVPETHTELTEEERPKGLHLWPKLSVLCEIFSFFLRKTIQGKFLNHCFSLGQWLPAATAKLFSFKGDPNYDSRNARFHLHIFPSPSPGHLFLHTQREWTSVFKPLQIVVEGYQDDSSMSFLPVPRSCSVTTYVEH